MGNTTSHSCISISIGSLKKRRNGTKTAMLLDTSGNIREIKLPVKTAELMIEEIGHVITPVDELRRTRRIWAIPADEELVAGKVYLLVPANRVHSKASDLEMAVAEQWGSEKESGQRQRKKGSGNMAKVSPSPLRERDAENEATFFPDHSQLLCPRLGSQARWNPVLEPIFESP